ncbi:geopeptide radical SAM maturase [Geotalea uraniireducens]|uniref:Radical SAM domain protein n=1 Tax=Geotalea uraniireducens (strain Rf4) TaxID=351605 RepID=A5GFE7_GEOUR|nr:geopeptide radical SAM maturase [Geotalea uraniireducens]ABQ26152.1 Radical SAM domain protein [Geotalea uraniireducens Rf4]
MILSRYLKIYPDSDRPGSYLLYSTRKGSVVRLSGDRLEAAREGTLTDAERETLRRLEILIDDPAAEREAMTSLVKRANARSNRFYAKVVMNLDCNLACPYCFEDHFRGRHYMTQDTARLLVDTVIREQIGRGRDVKLGFYGGEPLLSLPLIREIAIPLRDAAAEKGVKFSFVLTTNGTLLTRSVVEELLPLGLTGAIITLDGPREIHDRQRPFVSGAGSYDIIVANIKATFDMIELQLGGNYSRDDYREFPRMLDHLIAEGIPPERIGEVQFAPIIPKSGSGVTTGADTSACCTSGSEPWVTEAAPLLREEILKQGFKAMKPTQAACAIEFDNDLVVNYDGSLYKCPVFMGWPELSIGSLTEGTRDYSVSHNLDVWKTDECLECAYLPLCFGGCRLMPLMKNGVIDEVDCRKAFYDSVLERFILQDLQYPSSQTAT